MVPQPRQIVGKDRRRYLLACYNDDDEEEEEFLTLDTSASDSAFSRYEPPTSESKDKG